MKRPQNMQLEDYLHWVMNNELECEPDDWEKDCWIPRKTMSRVRGRPVVYWNKKTRLMYQLTYQALHGIEENPFSQQLHASHTCENSECVNPFHIVPETPDVTENRKLLRSGAEAYKKSQREKALTIQKMPTGLSHREKAEWILENCTWTDENGCKRYTGQTDERGYGRRNITVEYGVKKKLEMHRYIYTAMNDLPYGDDPNNPWNGRGKGFRVANHICNQPNCINPDHIELVSRNANALHARNTSRATKITEEDARAIIEDFMTISEWPVGSKKAFNQKWAEKLNVSIDVSSNIVFRKIRWKDLLAEYGLL